MPTNLTDQAADPTRRVRPVVFAFLLLALMTLGELRLRDRLLYANRVEFDFVAFNVAAIREGRPVFKAWQHRVLSPAAVRALGRLAGGDAGGIKIFSNLMIATVNLLLFTIVRRRGGNLVQSLVGAAVFGLGRLLLVYKLEYPWDGVDLVLFLIFGYAASLRMSLVRVVPLLLVGTLNHETALYMPLWYLLSPLDRVRRSSSRSSNRFSAHGEDRASALVSGVVSGALAFIAMGGAILLLRQFLYVGPPDLPGQTFEATTPVISNAWHAGHNLWQLLVEDWRHGRAIINAGVLSTVVLVVVLGAKTIDLQASIWSVMVFATIFCFGYLSETRLYLPLLAFWFGYAWPPRGLSAPITRPGPPPAARPVT